MTFFVPFPNDRWQRLLALLLIPRFPREGKHISIISRNNEVEELMPRAAVADNSIYLQHGTQAEDKYLSAGTLPATCLSIKEIISSSYYNKDLKKLNL